MPDTIRKDVRGMMKAIILGLAIAILGAPAAMAHGGGCRKNSPPGQCCHMDNSTGVVHCHY
ncbi:MAG: hypothetical protein KDJ86_19055 [Bauldia sp.]|uniref:hypothetical protein n=1 Tax=Bauldia sp. TaxID=2575872 RepID=UPI001D2DE862|nr:hypothetical protein [Bauldia sp.]MCB1497890.1 hypothetical protein [Bauldia sp.]